MACVVARHRHGMSPFVQARQRANPAPRPERSLPPSGGACHAMVTTVTAAGAFGSALPLFVHPSDTVQTSFLFVTAFTLR